MTEHDWCSCKTCAAESLANAVADRDLIDRLYRVRRALMEHDGWKVTDVDTVNEIISRLEETSL